MSYPPVFLVARRLRGTRYLANVRSWCERMRILSAKVRAAAREARKVTT